MPEIMSSIVITLLLIVAGLLALISLIIASFGLGVLWGAPYVGTPKSIVRRMIRLADGKAGETLVDLGSGTGSVLIVAAKEFGMQSIGYEINPFLRIVTRVRARLAGVADRVDVRSGNLFFVSLPPADVVTLFLLPAMIERLKPKLLTELPKGCRVVARDFPFTDWIPFAEDGWLKAYHPEDVL